MIKGPVSSGSGVGPLPDSQSAPSLCPYLVEGVVEPCGISYKGTNPIYEGSTLIT